MYEYNYENATEKKAYQKKYGRLELPPDDPSTHHKHLHQHENIQILPREALNGNVERCKEMIAELPEHQKGDIIHMLERSVAEHGRTINLHE